MISAMASLLFLAYAPAAADPFSRSTPAQVAVTHLDLDLRVGFAPRELSGRVLLSLARSAPGESQELVLDTKDLRIDAVAGVGPDGHSIPLAFALGEADPVLGAALSIALPPGVQTVRVDYRAGAHADALQWLEGRQTRSGLPFLYTQSGTIHARSWIPLQDSPAVRFTWEASVQAPTGLLPVMSATLVWRRGTTGRFRMVHPVPAYLMALAVGDLELRAWDARTGVIAERPVAAEAHREFRDVPRMLEVTEGLFGAYRWERYDLLVMPPAFPYAGVENAQLTFVTPTLLAGDGSLVSVVAHELAHAWAGNLVTQATWNDVWLNEGLAVYLERRIVEALYGRERAAAEAVLGRRRLLEELAALPPADQRLRVDFAGRDPDQVLSSVPYEKGYLFFLRIERDFGRPRLDAFLRRLFQEGAFQSFTTAQFLARLRQSLPGPLDAWIEEPGLPADAPRPSSPSLEAAERAATGWAAGRTAAVDLPAHSWSPEQWAWFLAQVPQAIDCAQAGALDETWHLGGSRNPTVLVPWLRLGIRCGYAPAVARAEEVLNTVGRGGIVMPLYEELLALPDGPKRAARIYCGARSSYHPVVAAALDRRLSCQPPR
jgi:aminopeptidase N